MKTVITSMKKQMKMILTVSSEFCFKRESISGSLFSIFRQKG